MNNFYLGLVGTNGAGKSTVCSLLKEKGFRVISLSDAVRQWVREAGLPLDRDNLTNMANIKKQELGLDVLAQGAYDLAQGAPLVVFDSVRHPKEVALLKSKGVRFVAVDADIDVRYQRVLLRQDTTDQVDYETFVRQEERERSGQSVGQNISAVVALCEHTLKNNGDMSDLSEALEVLLKALSCPE